MARIKISKHKAFDIELIKFDKKGPTFVNIRQMYSTQKDPEFKPGRQGMTFSLEEIEGKTEARRVVKALIKVIKNEDNKKPRLLEKRSKE